MDTVIVYTDGACSGNPGPGGWGALLMPEGDRDDATQLTGGAPQTTNNRMELTAALKALESLDEPTTVKLHTDSAYVSRAFNDGWLANWKQNGWRTSSKKPVKNKDLWQALDAQNERHDVKWIWVKGHADNVHNNYVDSLAVTAMEDYK
ncbi:ribonuclease HI [Longimonas halophila]|uniref:Ribonuclease H n=1 Tax=Longimonas halophila TaxID=1469170 RepID=A0A2H3P008_9BACT|nr:ribonuclease HI [Longimonas halophila]PEN06596.1 ribonuclease HI [Longimonas halophila]